MLCNILRQVISLLMARKLANVLYHTTGTPFKVLVAPLGKQVSHSTEVWFITLSKAFFKLYHNFPHSVAKIICNDLPWVLCWTHSISMGLSCQFNILSTWHDQFCPDICYEFYNQIQWFSFVTVRTFIC